MEPIETREHRGYTLELHYDEDPANPRTDYGRVMIDRTALIDARVTLDGRPARISGTRNEFASVRSLDGKLSGEWAWETVERVVARGGRFTL